MARKQKPMPLLGGYSSYPRDLDYAQFKAIADEVGAYTMADISHYGVLVAGSAMANPMDAGFDVVTMTTHKSLRGPRGGLILCREEFAKAIDSSVFPGLPGGPHMNQMAAVVVTLKHAATHAFSLYSQQVMDNSLVLASTLRDAGIRLLTGALKIIYWLSIQYRRSKWMEEKRRRSLTVSALLLISRLSLMTPYHRSREVVSVSVRLLRRPAVWRKSKCS
jgi:glycine/serine hydroxymethyltransferase